MWESLWLLFGKTGQSRQESSVAPSGHLSTTSDNRTTTLTVETDLGQGSTSSRVGVSYPEHLANVGIEKSEVLKQASSAGNDTDPFARMAEAALEKRNLAELEKAYEDFKKADSELSEIEKESLNQYLRFRAGDCDALTELDRIANDQSLKISERAAALNWLGSCHEESGGFGSAFSAYLSCDELYRSEGKAGVLQSVARTLALDRSPGEAIQFIISKFPALTKSKQQVEGYRALANLYGESGQRELKAIAIEQALALVPNDTKLLFRAAYNYSQEESESSVIALMHYETLLRFDKKDGAALNNAGVQFTRLNMPIKAVDSYKKASEGDSAISLANLAQLQLQAGFFDEAKVLIKPVEAEANSVPHIAAVLKEISEAKAAETKTYEAVLSTARRQQEFIRRFGSNYFAAGERGDFSGTWVLSSGKELVLKQSESRLTGEWKESLYEYTCVGEIVNRGAILTMTAKQSWMSPQTERSLIYLSATSEQIHMLRGVGPGSEEQTLQKQKATSNES